MNRLIVALALLLIAVPMTALAVDYTEPATGVTFVRIPGGSFDMGDTTHKGYDLEKPLHRVTVREFFIGTHEVTFQQYDIFAAATGRPLPDDAGWGRGKRPVINVSWEDATAFAAWLSKKTGKKIRLPSEAEWEYAARAGSSAAYWWGNPIGTGNANCSGCGSRWGGSQTAPVGSFAANGFGLYDVIGNVYEWVADRGHDTYRGAPQIGNAWDDGNAPTRMLRSSSFRDGPFDSRISLRNWANPKRRQTDTGFRLAMTP